MYHSPPAVTGSDTGSTAGSEGGHSQEGAANGGKKGLKKVVEFTATSITHARHKWCPMKAMLE